MGRRTSPPMWKCSDYVTGGMVRTTEDGELLCLHGNASMIPVEEVRVELIDGGAVVEGSFLIRDANGCWPESDLPPLFRVNKRIELPSDRDALGDYRYNRKSIGRSVVPRLGLPCAAEAGTWMPIPHSFGNRRTTGRRGAAGRLRNLARSPGSVAEGGAGLHPQRPALRCRLSRRFSGLRDGPGISRRCTDPMPASSLTLCDELVQLRRCGR